MSLTDSIVGISVPRQYGNALFLTKNVIKEIREYNNRLIFTQK